MTLKKDYILEALTARALPPAAWRALVRPPEHACDLSSMGGPGSQTAVEPDSGGCAGFPRPGHSGRAERFSGEWDDKPV